VSAAFIVAGVDGGGTKTQVLLADASGQPIVGVTGVGTALRPGGVDHTADTVAALVREALVAAEMPHVVPKAVCVGVAGAGNPALKQALWQALVAREVADDVSVHADASIALDDAFGEGAGVLLIAGTGSVAFGRGPTGAADRCGGWGPDCGDEGSGQWIGRRALSIVTAATDGREPDTALVGAVLTATQVDDARGLVAWAAAAQPSDYAALAPVVLAAAEGGDLRANTLVTLAAEELALHVRTLARRLFTDERAAVPVAFAGGLLARHSLLRRLVELRLKTAVPGAVIHAEEVSPARGAVRAALRLVGA
jgi:glucosamine kinase